MALVNQIQVRLGLGVSFVLLRRITNINKKKSFQETWVDESFSSDKEKAANMYSLAKTCSFSEYIELLISFNELHCKF